MSIRPYHAWVFLAAFLVLSAWRVLPLMWREAPARVLESPGWIALTRMTTEELDRNKAHRYGELARDLAGERDVGYFSEHDRSTLWSLTTPEGQDRIYRYYMGQGILAPSILRLDERWPKVVVDCMNAEQANHVAAAMRLTVIRDYGQGLVLARPEE